MTFPVSERLPHIQANVYRTGRTFDRTTTGRIELGPDQRRFEQRKKNIRGNERKTNFFKKK